MTNSNQFDVDSPQFRIIPPTTNVLARTFFLKSAQLGTAVSVQYKGEHYFITANHLIHPDPSKPLEIKSKDGWEKIDSAKLLARSEPLDIAIFSNPLRPSEALERLVLPLDIDGLFCGQHVHFLGFPLSMEEYVEFAGLDNRPFPFQRGAIVSSLPKNKLILDGLNTVGFSGGPVVFYQNGVHKVCGIVTGYKEEICMVEMPDADWQTELDAIYKQNTGITYATPASSIQQMIDGL